jgi:hypothetical protein
MDEMMITNGIMYSVSRNRVFGLAEIPSHGIKVEIYSDFYGMSSESPQNENLSSMNYFEKTAEKLKGHSATGLTQVCLLTY